MRYLVTGAAGFIGMQVARRLLEDGHAVATIDNLNSYYHPALKQARLALLRPHEHFTFHEASLADGERIQQIFREGRFDGVIHLAAQAGVRHSLHEPFTYAESNLHGFLHILEGCRQNRVAHLVFASSSSVYGLNRTMPFAVADNVDHPISLYAATKKANELMAHSYSHLYGLPATGLRFFTVYGPWGRPDMSPFLFTHAILHHRPIKLYNEGQNRRGFTYIDDIVEAVVAIAGRPAAPNPAWDGARPDPGSSSAPWRIFNIGSPFPVTMIEFVATLEDALGAKAIIELHPPAPGDMEATAADIRDLEAATGCRPTTALADGLRRFVQWYRDHRVLADRCVAD
jgi:UDP-glucuronate 4-epimerase